MLIVNAIGGLGNRMRAISSGFKMALDTKQKLYVVWDSNSELRANYDELFQMNELFEVIDCNSIEYQLKYSVPRKRNLYISAIYQYFAFKCMIDGKNLPYKGTPEQFLNDVLKAKHTLISSGLEFYKYDNLNLSELFIPTPEICTLVNELSQDITKHTVGLHIRRTDNYQAIQFSPIEKFIDIINSCFIEDPNTNFYVATDDLDVKQSLKNKFGSAIITNDIPLDRNDTMAIKYSVAEMFALGKTSKIYGSFYSSYSGIAAEIHGTPQFVVK